jgi:hypothetical protein
MKDTRKKLAAIFAPLALGMGGCTTMHAGIQSPLSGKDQQNVQACMPFDTAQAKAVAVPVGTPKAKVYEAFGIRGDGDLRLLDKEEVNRTLYGQTMLSVPFDQKDAMQSFMNSLEGRSLSCEDVNSKRSYGLTHSRVERTGHRYTVTFVFRDAALYDPVHISGAPVRQVTDHGYLSDFNPGGLLLRKITP